MAKSAVLLLAVYVSFILIELATLSAPVNASPPVTSHTPAKLTNNNFSNGGSGTSGPSECDGKYHKNSELIVALSTGWYDHGSRCGKKIRITAKNGKSVVAKVVDECDEHGGCKNNIVDGSDAVWKALGLNINLGVVPVHWALVK